jgi:hypothetical protein
MDVSSKRKRSVAEQSLEALPRKRVCGGDVYTFRLAPKNKLRTAPLKFITAPKQFWMVPDQVVPVKKKKRYTINRFTRRKVVWD